MRILLGAILCALGLAPAAARAGEPLCPATLTDKQSAEAPAGWAAAVDPGPYRLAGLTFYDGPPSEQASLAPDKEARGKGTSTSTWRFGKPRPRPLWLECN